MSEQTREENHARGQASAQMSSIVSMVAALELDWDRLEELRDELAEYQENDDVDGRDSILDELTELEAAAGEYQSREEAEEAINDDPLSVEVRSDWVAPGEEMKAGEFKILLCTGGPAVQIRGELDQYGEPCRAWLEYQDWFTPWVEYHGENADQDTLLTYCRQFYFGEC